MKDVNAAITLLKMSLNFFRSGVDKIQNVPGSCLFGTAPKLGCSKHS